MRYILRACHQLLSACTIYKYRPVKPRPFKRITVSRVLKLETVLTIIDTILHNVFKKKRREDSEDRARYMN